MTRCAAADSPAMSGGGGRQAEQQKGGQISNTVLYDRWYTASLDALLGAFRPVVVMWRPQRSRT